MPWPKEHKTQTRARIVAAAADTIREQGPQALGVADVMARAGLTHGGFYAHFASKEELLVEALAMAAEASMTPLAQSAGTDASAERWRAVVDAYLSPWHLSHVAAGCPVAALAPEVSRTGGRLQRTLARAIRERIEWFRTLLPRSAHRRDRRDDAMAATACMVGGLVLARALGGDEGREVLTASRRFLERALAE